MSEIISENVKFLNEWELMSRRTFISDYEKMRDFFQITKEEFLESYFYVTEKEYDVRDSNFYSSLEGSVTRDQL